jgi:hypothetical protein
MESLEEKRKIVIGTNHISGTKERATRKFYSGMLKINHTLRRVVIQEFYQGADMFFGISRQGTTTDPLARAHPEMPNWLDSCFQRKI